MTLTRNIFRSMSHLKDMDTASHKQIDTRTDYIVGKADPSSLKFVF